MRKGGPVIVARRWVGAGGCARVIAAGWPSLFRGQESGRADARGGLGRRYPSWQRLVPAGLLPILMLVALAGCSSDPNAPVNQSYPIRSMDNFFRSLPGPDKPPTTAPAPAKDPDYTHQPGYAPAYPPY